MDVFGWFRDFFASKTGTPPVVVLSFLVFLSCKANFFLVVNASTLHGRMGNIAIICEFFVLDHILRSMAPRLLYGWDQLEKQIIPLILHE